MKRTFLKILLTVIFCAFTLSVIGKDYNEKISLSIQFSVNTAPAVPGIEGIRMFTSSIDATTNKHVHTAHTDVADAVISTNGITYNTTSSSKDVVKFSLPVTTTLSSAAVWSPTTYYSIPANSEITHIVVKLSYIYKGTTVYDVRVPIELPSCGLKAGKYYKYTINIAGVGNGTNDPNEADSDKDVIDVVNSSITVNATINDYSAGHEDIITIN